MTSRKDNLKKSFKSTRDMIKDLKFKHCELTKCIKHLVPCQKMSLNWCQNFNVVLRQMVSW